MEEMKSQITIQISAELLAKFREEASEKGYTVTELILFILHDHFQSIAQE